MQSNNLQYFLPTYSIPTSNTKLLPAIRPMGSFCPKPN